MDAFWTSGFWRDLNEGDINFRDNLQFELKSRFPVNPKTKKNVFKQEFFMFIPETLKIDKWGYLREFFYMDQTNLIRYQTPVFTLQDLTKPQTKRSPYNRIKELSDKREILEELKLLAATFRSALRLRVRSLVLEMQKGPKTEEFTVRIDNLTSDLKNFRDHFSELKADFYAKQKEEMLLHFFPYIEEYIVNTIDYYFTGLLDRLRGLQLEKTEDMQKRISQIILDVDNYRQEYRLMPKKTKDPVLFNENIMHRNSLLNKFVMEALKLNTNRQALQEKYGHALGAFAAGIAMFVYLMLFALALFVWETPPVIWTSFPIILIAVVLYILKDRLKEGMKVIYKHHAFKWFPDYSTKIESPLGDTLGDLKEFFSFIDEKDLPEGFLTIRNEKFHDELPYIKRPESIIQYKREVHLYHQPGKKGVRRRDLNTIFRFNVHRFIEKANNYLQTHLSLDPNTGKLVHEKLPKVYHLNIIIRNTYQSTSEIDKFRVVVDKTGIKRVEKL